MSLASFFLIETCLHRSTAKSYWMAPKLKGLHTSQMGYQGILKTTISTSIGWMARVKGTSIGLFSSRTTKGSTTSQAWTSSAGKTSLESSWTRCKQSGQENSISSRKHGCYLVTKDPLRITWEIPNSKLKRTRSSTTKHQTLNERTCLYSLWNQRLNAKEKVYFWCMITKTSKRTILINILSLRMAKKLFKKLDQRGNRGINSIA